MNTKIRVLFIEDSEDDAFLVLRQLKEEGFQTIWKRVDTPEQLLTVLALDNQSWDLALVDFQLENFTGLDALRILNSFEVEIPSILFSGIMNDEIGEKAVEIGAKAYVYKDDYRELVPLIRRHLSKAVA